MSGPSSTPTWRRRIAGWSSRSSRKLGRLTTSPFPQRRRTLPTRYNSTRSTLLDAVVRERLRPDQYRLGAPIAAIAPTLSLSRSGERIEPRRDRRARARTYDALDLGWQKFVGREVRLAAPHGLERPIVMDACVDQQDGYRFVYCLPFAQDRLLIEDTYYSHRSGARPRRARRRGSRPMPSAGLADRRSRA